VEVLVEDFDPGAEVTGGGVVGVGKRVGGLDDAGEEHDQGAAHAEVHACDEEVALGRRRVEVGRAVSLGVKGGVDALVALGPTAEHLGLPEGVGGAGLEGDEVVDGQMAVGLLGVTEAIAPEWAGRAGSLGGAALGDVECGPAEDGSAASLGLSDDVVHQTEGAVEGGEGFDRAGDGPVGEQGGVGDELSGAPDLGVEEVDLVAAELVDVAATDGGLGLA
jgi:hypothetical protein